MAVFTTYGLPDNKYHRSASPDLTGALDALTHDDLSPPRVPYAVSSSNYVVVTNNLPISERQAVITAYAATSFLDDYYGRIHILPSVVDVGNLLSAQTRDVEVWNAYFVPKLLSSVTEQGTDGLELTEPLAAPTSYAALESRTYTLNISINGSPTVNALYTFGFPDEDPTLGVIGRRVVIWPFMPQTRHRETLEWATDILPSFNAEQRMAMRLAPRQSINYDFRLPPHQFSRAKAFATQWSHRVYGVPVWSELAQVGALSAGATEILFNTTKGDFRADDVIIVWESDANNVAVETLTVAADRVTLKLPLSASYANAYVAPLRFATTPEGISFSRGASTDVEASATFLVTNNIDLSAAGGYPVYRSRDVLTETALLIGDMSERISRSMDFFDNGSGPVEQDVKTDWVMSKKTITFEPVTKSERWRVRRWLHRMRGKQASFWLPSWNPDLDLLYNLGDADGAITVREIGYTLFYGVTDIMVQLKTGTRYFARVLSSTNDVDGEEVLVLDAPIGVAITVAEVDKICFMSHCRFDTDRVQIRHGYTGQITISIPVVETPE